MDRLVFSSFLRHHLSASRFLHSSRGLIGRSRYFSSDTAEKLGLFGAKVTGSLEVAVVPALQDNYMYLVKHLSSGNMLCVDPADANAVELALQTLSWPIHKLRFILNTHHHMDHVGGNIELQAKAKNAIIVGSSKGASRIPGIQIKVDETTGFAFEDVQFQVLEVPGHTRDHIAYYFKDEKYPILFCADSLFSLGCGKLFEGSPSEMTDSLKKYLQLPKETLVYCGHEYTRSNAKFAMHILPNNPHLKKKMEELKDRHKACTIPSTLGQEFLMNPFLRLHTDEVRSALGFTPEEDDFEVFARLRSMKDRF